MATSIYSVIVSNLPPKGKKRHIQDYFSRVCRDVGDVIYTLYPLGADSQRALVAFSSAAALQIVLSQKHQFEGRTLRVRRAPRQTYERCTAEVAPEVESCLLDVDATCRQLQADFGVTVSVSEGTGQVILIGSLLQIQAAQGCLEELAHAEQAHQRADLDQIGQDAVYNTPREEVPPQKIQHNDDPHLAHSLPPMHLRSQHLSNREQKRDSQQVVSTEVHDSQNIDRQAMVGDTVKDMFISSKGSQATDETRRQAWTGEAETCVELDNLVVDFLEAVHFHKLRAVEAKHYVSIHFSRDPELATAHITLAHPHPAGDAGLLLQQAKKEFTSLYEMVFYQIVRETLSFEPGSVLRSECEAVLGAVQQAFIKTVILRENTPGNINVVGEPEQVAIALDWMKRKLGLKKSKRSKSPTSNQSNSSQGLQSKYVVQKTTGKSKLVLILKPAQSDGAGAKKSVSKHGKNSHLTQSMPKGEFMVQGTSNLLSSRSLTKTAPAEMRHRANSCNGSPAGQTQASSVDSKASDSQKLKLSTSQGDVPTTSTTTTSCKTHFQFATHNAVRVSVCVGDLISVPSDVLVVVTNESLQCVGPLAQHVTEAAGPELQEAATQFVQKFGPLKVGDVAPLPGSGCLQCQYILCMVAPVWGQYPDKDRCATILSHCFTKAFHFANTVLEAQSLALPALSTDMDEVPLDMCARSLFEAVTNFDANSPPSVLLHEIFILNPCEESASVISAIFQQLHEAAHIEDGYQSDLSSMADEVPTVSRRRSSSKMLVLSRDIANPSDGAEMQHAVMTSDDRADQSQDADKDLTGRHSADPQRSDNILDRGTADPSIPAQVEEMFTSVSALDTTTAHSDNTGGASTTLWSSGLGHATTEDFKDVGSLSDSEMTIPLEHLRQGTSKEETDYVNIAGTSAEAHFSPKEVADTLYLLADDDSGDIVPHQQQLVHTSVAAVPLKSPEGSPRSVRSDVSVKSVRSEASVHSETSHVSIRSGKSQTSVKSEMSQASVKSERSQASMKSERSHASSLKSERSQASIKSEKSQYIICPGSSRSHESGSDHSHRSSRPEGSHSKVDVAAPHSEQFVDTVSPRSNASDTRMSDKLIDIASPRETSMLSPRVVTGIESDADLLIGKPQDFGSPRSNNSHDLASPRSNISHEFENPGSNRPEDLVPSRSQRSHKSNRSLDLVSPRSHIPDDIVPPRSNKSQDVFSPRSHRSQDSVSPQSNRSLDLTSPRSNRSDDIVSSRSNKSEDIISPSSHRSHDIVSPRSNISHAVVSPRLNRSHDVVSPRSNRSHVVSPRSNRSHDIVSPRSNRSHDVVSPRSNRSHDVVSPRSNRSHDVVSPRSNRLHDGVSPRSNRSHDVVSPRSNRSHDVVSLRSNRSHDVVSPRSNRSHNVVSPRSNRSHDVSPRSNRSHDVVSPRSNCSHDVVSPRSNRSYDVSPRSNRSHDVVSPRSNRSHDVVSPRSNRSHDASPTSNRSLDIVSPRSHRSYDVVSPSSHRSLDLVSPRSNLPEDVVSPRSNRAEEVISPRSSRSHDVVSPRSNRSLNFASPRSSRLQDIISPRANRPEDMSQRLHSSETHLDRQEDAKFPGENGSQNIFSSRAIKSPVTSHHSLENSSPHNSLATGAELNDYDPPHSAQHPTSSFQQQPSCTFQLPQFIPGRKRSDMYYEVDRRLRMPGKEEAGVIVLTFKEAQQDSPKVPKVAYLPNSLEARSVLPMMSEAFTRGLVFPPDGSTSTIELKTNLTGGQEKQGFPDETYLCRLKQQLEKCGLTGEK